jgi:histidinol phosphatase-like PHP family hydrolase
MITSNWHQHTHHSVECHDNGRSVDAAIEQSVRLGFLDFGITDHIHTPVNRPDVVGCSEEFWICPRASSAHLGVEVSVVSRWELDRIAAGAERPPYGIRQGGPAGGELAIALDPEDVRALRIEYVVGGTHWPMYVPTEREAVIRDYHRQNLFLASHPLVTIVAHPWWWMGAWKGRDGLYGGPPWFDDFGAIPASMHDEFAAALVANGKIVEVNAKACLENPEYPERFKRRYAELVAFWKERGAALSFGTDHHDFDGENDPAMLESVERRLAAVGVTDRDFWRLPPRL